MWSCRCCPTPGRSNCTLTPAASSTSDGPTPLNISTCGLPIEPPARTTSLLTVTVWRAADADAAYSTLVAVRLFAFEVSKMRRVTVAFGRMARLEHGGSGSM